MQLYLVTNTLTSTQYVSVIQLNRSLLDGDDISTTRNVEEKDIFIEPSENTEPNEWEKFLIDALRQAGELYNLTDGGEGLRGLIRTEDHCKRISLAHRSVSPDRSTARAEQMRKVAKESWDDPTFRKRQAARNHGQLARLRLDPEFEKNRIDRLNKKMNSPEPSKKNAEHARRICHRRWHVNRGITNPDYPLCQQMKEARCTNAALLPPRRCEVYTVGKR